MAPPPARDSAVLPCLHGSLAFLQRHFPLWSPPSHPRGLSPRSKQQTSPWDCSLIPILQLPARASARIVSVNLIPFRLSQMSASLSNSLKGFPSVPKNCPNVRIWPLLQLHHPPSAGPSCSLSLFSLLPSSYWVLHGSIYSFMVIRHSCLLSVAVLWDLIYLKMYSWCFVERDVLYVYLLLHHLVLPPVSFFIIIIVVFAFSVILLLNLTQDPQWHSSSCCLFAIIWNWTLATIITTKIDSS